MRRVASAPLRRPMAGLGPSCEAAPRTGGGVRWGGAGAASYAGGSRGEGGCGGEGARVVPRWDTGVVVLYVQLPYSRKVVAWRIIIGRREWGGGTGGAGDSRRGRLWRRRAPRCVRPMPCLRRSGGRSQRNCSGEGVALRMVLWRCCGDGAAAAEGEMVHMCMHMLRCAVLCTDQSTDGCRGAPSTYTGASHALSARREA